MLTSRALIAPQGRFTWAARWFALRLALLVPFIHIHLMMFGYNRTLAMLQRFVPAHPAPAVPSADIEDFALGMRRLVRRVGANSPLPGSCFSRSLGLWWLLHAQGIKTSLHVGTRRFEKQFQAHAWVEYCSRPLNAGMRVQSKYLDFKYDFTPSHERVLQY